jgi:hypothetical protein
VAQEQQDKQPKNEQSRQKRTARGQHPKDKSTHYKPQQEHPSGKHKGDEQAAECGEAQTHHEAKSRSHTCDEAQGRQLRTKSVDLMPNSRELIEDNINGSIILAKKLLLTNSSKESRLSSGLIATTKKSPYLMSLLKLHNISRKPIHQTSRKNRTSSSILIKPSPVCIILRLI